MAQVEFGLIGTNGTISIEAKDIMDIESGISPSIGKRLTKISFGTEMKDTDGDNRVVGQNVLVTGTASEAITKVAAALDEQA